jgi:hypothetical protein
MHDARVCPICQAIDGYVWVFEADAIPNELWHPVFSFPVWTVALGSGAHGHDLDTCRCDLELDIVSFADLVLLARGIADALEGSIAAGTVKADVFQ